MKLFIVAALVAAVSAARLDHLERGYLPPSQNNYAANSGGSGFPSANAHGSFGLSNQGSQYNAAGHGSNGFGSFGRANDFVANGQGSNGFGANGQGSNGFGNNGQRSNGFGSSFGFNGASGRNGASSAATSNQYLPPNYGAPGSNGGSSFGSSIKSSCSTCGSSTFGSQRYQPSSFGSQNPSIPSTQYGRPQSFIPASTFDSQSNFAPQQDEPIGASRQYLAPKASSAQNAQQPFDENTGYIY